MIPFFISYRMTEMSRDELLLMIEQGMRSVVEVNGLLAIVIGKLADTTLSEEDTLKLQTEKDDLEDELSELRIDIAMSEEHLHILDMNAAQDDRCSSDHEERYDPNDEVFTGGDY